MNNFKAWVNYKGINKPEYQTPGSAGCDLVSTEKVSLNPGERKLIGTGLFLEIPEGYVGMVCPRSGLALKNGITVLNGPGIIDSDYRGEVKVMLVNLSGREHVVEVGDRIAQLLLSPVVQAKFVQKDELSNTSRSEGGFGSTGK